MRFEGKITIITGAASGIGAAMARALAREGAQVAVADKDAAGAEAVAAEIGGLALTCDVTREADIQELVRFTETQLGPVDIFISNAGLAVGESDHAASASDAVWQTLWDVHVMAHVRAARAVLPGMRARGSGHLVQIASAAGLLSQIGDAAYSATKHAAVGFAESLAITHGREGIGVSLVCPQYVATPLLGYGEGDAPPHSGILSPDAVARAVIEGVAEGRFLILPHPQVADYFRAKANDYERWITGMQKLRARVSDQAGSVDLDAMHRLV